MQQPKQNNMAQPAKLQLLLALLLLLLVHANCQSCALATVEVEQRNTGARVGFDPVFEVVVRNRCRCALRNVFLRSEGFASSVAVDPKLLRREGAGYLLGDGRRIANSETVTFRYAWDRAFRMAPASLQDECS